MLLISLVRLKDALPFKWYIREERQHIQTNGKAFKLARCAYPLHHAYSCTEREWGEERRGEMRDRDKKGGRGGGVNDMWVLTKGSTSVGPWRPQDGRTRSDWRWATWKIKGLICLKLSLAKNELCKEAIFVHITSQYDWDGKWKITLEYVSSRSPITHRSWRLARPLKTLGEIVVILFP